MLILATRTGHCFRYFQCVWSLHRKSKCTGIQGTSEMDELSHAMREQLIALFQQHGLPFNDDDDDVEALHAGIAQDFATWLPVAAVQGILPRHIAALLPDRWLEYDTERIYDHDDYAILLRMFAERTIGEWQLERLTSVEEYDNGGRLAVLTFTSAGKYHAWGFPLYDGSDWVDQSFAEEIRRFAARYLSGDFVRVPPGGQSDAYVYLPRPVATELPAVIASLMRDARARM